MREKSMEVTVGFFMLAGLFALLILAFKISGLTLDDSRSAYMVTADFNNIGILKVRSPVKIGGVKIGEVTKIRLNKITFKAIVSMQINHRANNIPTDSSAQILTAGLLGSNYVSLTPGFDDTYLQNASEITTTHSALILENLIGQLVYKLGSSDD